MSRPSVMDHRSTSGELSRSSSELRRSEEPRSLSPLSELELEEDHEHEHGSFDRSIQLTSSVSMPNIPPRSTLQAHGSLSTLTSIPPGPPGPPSEAPTAVSSLSRMRSSMRDNLSIPNTPIEEYIAKYQVIKCSWRGKYERIFALGPTRFCTIDPKDFEVTNTWPMTALLGISLEQGDDQGFSLQLKGAKKDEQLKLRCRFRSRLLSDLYRLQEQCLPRRRVQTQHPCAKYSRLGTRIEGMIEVGKDGLIFLHRDGTLRSTYLYVEMEHLSVCSDASDAFVFGYGGRPRLFFSDRRSNIANQIYSAAESIGMFLAQRNGLTVTGVQNERHHYGKDAGKQFVQFRVQKITTKFAAPVERTLSLHQRHIVELDLDGGVVSSFEYSQVYTLVRSIRNAHHFDVQFLNGMTTHYSSDDRDGVLAAIYDLCVACDENPELFITSVPNERGLRLLPCFATEDTVETHSFFGETSIGICFLQRMTAVGKLGSSRRMGDRGFVEIVEEFNANVPASGIFYDTKQGLISDALRSIGAQLYYVSKSSPVASRSAVVLLQALFRIASSYYGFREVAQITHLADSITNILLNGDEFAVFWSTLLLKRLTVHVPPASSKLDPATLRSCEEVEASNKSILLGNTYLMQSLVAHLGRVDVKGASRNPASRKRPVGPLVIMGMLQTLEPALCSCKHTTGSAEFQLIVSELAKHYSTLLKILFQSRCATTVEACTLLLKTILEECEPSAAMRIRDAALAEGIVLRHFYQAIFDPSFDQRAVSRYLISLWMSHHPPSKELLARMIPRGFLPYLDEPMPSAAEQQELEQHEREQIDGTMNDDALFSTMSDESLRESDLWSPPPSLTSPRRLSEGSTGRPPSFGSSQSSVDLNSRATLARTGRSMSTFDARGSLYIAAASARETAHPQIENEFTKSRMLRKLQSSSVSTRSRDESSQRMDGASRAGTQRVRKRDIAYDFISNALHKTKTERLQPTARSKKTTKQRGALYVKDEREPENFRLLFHMINRDHEKVDLIWNQQTRVELQRTLRQEIQIFSQYQHSAGSGKAVWNFEDFRVEYISLSHEIMVGGCYLRVLCGLPDRLMPIQIPEGESGNAQSVVVVTSGKEDRFVCLQPEDVSVRDPRRVVEHLYRRVLRENVRAEIHNDVEATLACLRGISIVGGAYAKFAGLTELDEVEYLIQLIINTAHIPVLESLVAALRSLTMAKWNAKKILENESNLDTIMSLLQLGHLANATPGVQKLWSLHMDCGDSYGPLSTSELRDLIEKEKLDVKQCMIERCRDDVCDLSEDTKEYLLDNMQLRWQVGIRGDLDPLQAAYDAINIMLSLAHSSNLGAASEEGKKGSLFPVLRSKTLLWRRVREIIPLLGCRNHPELTELTSRLLNILYADPSLMHIATTSDDASSRSSLYLWGLFFMVFLVDTNNFDDIAGLLKATHLFQDEANGVSALHGILPDAMISLLDSTSPSEFAQVFCSEYVSPTVIWNQAMRSHLRRNCLAHLSDYLEILGEDVSSTWQFCPMAPVSYTDLESDIWCGGVYLSKFCERPDFVIKRPLEFVRTLTRKWRQEADRKGASFSYEQAAQILGVEYQSYATDAQAIYRDGFKRKARELQANEFDATAHDRHLADFREAYRVLTAPRQSLLTPGHDPVNLLLILNSLVEMCSRYPSELATLSFDCYGLLLSLLSTHATAEGVTPAETTPEQRLEIAVCAAELLFSTCSVSLVNAEGLLKQQNLNILEQVVNYCVDAMINSQDEHDDRWDQVCFFVLQTVTGLVSSHSGRVWISGTTTMLVDMARILWMWNYGQKRGFLQSKMTQQTLESISRMALLESNQRRLLEKGIVWQLLALFSVYNSELDDNVVQTRLRTNIKSPQEEFDAIAEEVQNVLAIMAVRALCRLGGFFPPESELSSPPNSRLQAVMDAMFTPNLAKLLLLDSHHEFLKIFHGDCESYTLFWNESMRQEVFDLITPRAQAQPSSEVLEAYEDAIKFRFEYLANVFSLGELYVDTLIGSLIVLQQSELPAPSAGLGLTDRFFTEIFEFIDSAAYPKVRCELEKGKDWVELPPYAGWKLKPEELQTDHRVAALHCLAIASDVATKLVESHVVRDTSVIKMLLRLLFPPDNEVHQNDDEQQSLVFPDELYEPSRYHCITILQGLATQDAFGKLAYEVGMGEILIEVVHLCRDVGPIVLQILRNLCRAGARREYIADILQAGTYLEFIGWLVGVEEPAEDEDVKLREELRRSCAEVLSELARPGVELSEEGMIALNRFFPVALTEYLIARPQDFVEFYQNNHETPELVWNDDMRTHLRYSVITVLNAYYSSDDASESGQTATDDEDKAEEPNAATIIQTFAVDYTGICPHPMCGNVYLHLYMRNPTFRLRDPMLFASSLWNEFEHIYRELAHLTSSLRQTRSPDDDMIMQQDEGFLDLVTASLVCVLRVNPWVLESMAEAKIPEKCCAYLNECTRTVMSMACAVSVVRLLRVFSTSKHCVAAIQPFCSTLISCLIAQVNPSRYSVLHREAGYTLEIIRRVIANFPNSIANGEGIVTIAMRTDLFGYFLNILETPTILGSVAQPHLVRAIAIDVLNMLEKDRMQAKAAHDILKKNKKWEKKFRHEAVAIPVPATPEDPFLVTFSPDIDRIISQCCFTGPPSQSGGVPNGFGSNRGMREPMVQKYRNSPRRQTTNERVSLASSNGSSKNGSGKKKGPQFRKLFSSHN
ncbi:hypothetical protein Poli38472_000872 [Pythium oligandrum]|uniref:DnaJ homologue subfamily C GRV2/DNAJC13 N-terminal domain-containing protein n=1 Tax=Pythium oligandrum TaxID=41045 RepID=A0A8K1CDK0_PYTOL|nr:hypothetical protein Poli38472_000872 [Pythium oligandrum]|eukprot:TMW60830.1 hypothetical protein Poli38472_000872 [Pythium oligandrum]